jgi:fumarate reductase subunit D
MKPVRSNAPVFWAMFGAGGMLAALFGPMLVLITGVLAPLGVLSMSYGRMLRLAQHPAGTALLFALISLFAWHAAHRIFHSLHDIGVRTTAWTRLACYGAALAITVGAAVALWRIGFPA